MPNSVTRTVRIDKELDGFVQELAGHERMSYNALVNRSLRQLVDWDRFAEQFGMVTITPSILEELIERFSVDEARDLGKKSVDNSAKNAIELMFGEFNLASVIEFLRRFGAQSRRFKFDSRQEDRRMVLVVRHGMGLKWSAYFEGTLKSLLTDGLGLKVVFRTTPDVCFASIST